MHSGLSRLKDRVDSFEISRGKRRSIMTVDVNLGSTEAKIDRLASKVAELRASTAILAARLDSVLRRLEESE